MRALALTALVLLIAAAAALAWQGRALQAARAEAPGPIDIGFAQAMGRHHQQAIAMAHLVLDGRPTSLAWLARPIADAQLLELGQMQGWLRLWDQPLAPPDRAMPWMRLGRAPPDAALAQYLLECERSPAGMPGLASDADLQRLRTLEGRPRDALFLQLMQAHHAGGMPMARFAAREAALAPVRRLAAQVVREQSEELARIQHLLAALAASGGQ